MLLAAGNKYQMKGVLEALRIQYLPGMSYNGFAKGFVHFVFHVQLIYVFESLHLQGHCHDR